MRHHLGNMHQHLITPRIPIRVVERFEIIQVQMTSDKRPPTREPLRDMGLNLRFARQPRQRV